LLRESLKINARLKKKVLSLATLLLIGVGSLLGPTPAFAALGEICGDGIDNDASGGDLACPAPDADRDGYYTNGLGENTGTDCDDSNRWIYPGISTSSGCSAGNYRTCQSDGTYTSCSALSGFTCHSGSGATYFIDDDETTCTGDGSYNDEEDWRCFSDTGMSGYHAPVAGDCFVLKAGTYSSTWSSSTRHIYVSNMDGTSSNPIRIMALPGDTFWELGAGSGVLIDGAGTSTSVEIEAMVNLAGSDHWKVSGLEGTIGASGYVTAGIYVTSADTTEVFNNSMHDINGNCGSNNCAGVKINDVDNAEVHHNLVYGVWQLSSVDNTNAYGILMMESECGGRFHNNISFGSTTNGYGVPMSVKHGGQCADSGAPYPRFDHNIIGRSRNPGAVIGCLKNFRFDHNYLEEAGSIDGSGSLGPSIRVADGGGGDDNCAGIVIEDNTIKNGSPFTYNIENDINAYGTPAVTWRRNIVVDNQTTAYNAGFADGFGVVYYSGSDSFCSALSTSNLVFAQNCYANTDGENLTFTFFGDNSGSPGGATCGTSYTGASGYTNWAAAWETGSFNENAALDEYGRATSANCKYLGGWLQVPSVSSSTCGRLAFW
jgi:hypothetical protein